MADESTQRHTEKLVSPAAHYRAFSQHGTPSPKKQSSRYATFSRRATRILATILCLLVGLWYVWTTHDLLGFVLMYAIATGAINAREVVGKMLPERAGEKEPESDHAGDPESKEDKGE